MMVHPGTTPEPARRERDPWELASALAALRRHGRVSLSVVLGCLALAALSLLLPRSYVADALLAYDPQTPLIKGGGSVAMTDPLRDAEMDAQLDAAVSLPVARDVARTLDLAANPDLAHEADVLAAHSDRPLGRDEALGTALLKHAKARRVGQTPDFTISVTAASADQAARIANGFAASYLQAALVRKTALAAAGARQLEANIAQLRERARTTQGDLAQFRLANHLLDTPDSLALDQEVAALRGQLADARGQAALAGTRSAAAGATTVVGGGNSGSIDTSPVSVLTQQQAEVAAELAGLLARHGDRHPDVIAARQRLAGLDAQRALALAGNRHSAIAEARSQAARAAAVAGSLAEAQSRLAGNLAHQARLDDLQNSALAARQAYQDVLKIAADQSAQRALMQPDAQQIGMAMPPLRPKFPRAIVNLPVGLVLGVMLAGLVAVSRRSWSHTLGSVGDIGRWLQADYFTPLPLLTPARRSAGATDPADMVLANPHSPVAERYRSLGTAALFAAGPGDGMDKGVDGGIGAAAPGRVIGVTAARAGEGTTTACIAMGRALAGAGFKVAILARVGGVGDAGLSGVRQIDGSGVALIDSQPDPDGSRLARTITALCRDYAVVVVDIAPVLAGGAHRRVLECTDALILLARWRSTPVRAIREAMHQIAVAGGRVSGVALSMVEGPGH